MPVKVFPHTPDRSLFHYTTPGGLAGILRSQSLWASHPTFLNDETEGQNLLPVVVPFLSDELVRASQEMVDAGIMKKELLASSPETFRTEAERLASIIWTTANDISPPYVTSFCKHAAGTDEHRDGLLSQWRAYAQSGVAIEFSELGLDKLLALEAKQFGYSGRTSCSIYYDTSNVSLALFDGMGRAFLRAFVEDHPKLASLPPKWKNLTTLEFVSSYLGWALFVKDPGFREENEYRIAMLCDRKKMSEETTLACKPIQFRINSRGLMIPYIELFSTLKQPLPIKSILVGPHPHQDDQAYSIQLLLEQCGLPAVPVRTSKIPYRQ